MIVKDYYCIDCGQVYEDIELSSGDVTPICETCKIELTWLPTKMHFDSKFVGSHNSEYGAKHNYTPNENRKVHTKRDVVGEED